MASTFSMHLFPWSQEVFLEGTVCCLKSLLHVEDATCQWLFALSSGRMQDIWILFLSLCCFIASKTFINVLLRSIQAMLMFPVTLRTGS